MFASVVVMVVSAIVGLLVVRVCLLVWQCFPKFIRMIATCWIQYVVIAFRNWPQPVVMVFATVCQAQLEATKACAC